MDEERKQVEIIRSLGLDVMLPPMYDIERGVVTSENKGLVDSTGKPLNLDEMDVFELARLRGTSVSNLKELMNDRNARLEEQKEQLRLTG